MIPASPSPTGPFVRRAFVSLLFLGMVFAAFGAAPVARAQDDQGFIAGDAAIVDIDLLAARIEPSSTAEITATLIDGTYGIINAGPETADGVVWYQLFVDDFLGWVTPDFLQPADSEHGLLPVGTTVVVIADQINLRNAPSTGGRVLQTMLFSDRPYVVSGPTAADGYDWYEVTIGDTTGWTVRDFLAFAPQDVAELNVGDVVMVNTGWLNLRADVGVDGDVVATLEGGTLLTLIDGPALADGWTWFQVDTGETTGWAVGEFLTN